MKKMMILAAIAATGSLWAAQPALDTLICHRGESHDAPENTLPAYQMAVDRGFGFECDIYLSTDGRLFTFHDHDLKRTSGGANTKRCTNASWADEVSKLNVGGWGRWKGSKFDPTRPALLEEVLALARPGRKIYVEVKGGAGAVKWVPTIKQVFAKEPKATPETALFICFNKETCAELKRQMPEYKVYWLTDCLKSPDEVVSVLKAIGVDGVDIQFKSEIIDERYVRTVKDAGFEFHVWTVDDIVKARRAFEVGADTLTTNCAQKLLDEYEK